MQPWSAVYDLYLSNSYYNNDQYSVTFQSGQNQRRHRLSTAEQPVLRRLTQRHPHPQSPRSLQSWGFRRSAAQSGAHRSCDVAGGQECRPQRYCSAGATGRHSLERWTLWNWLPFLQHTHANKPPAGVFRIRRVLVAGNGQPIPRDPLPAVSYKWYIAGT